MSLLALILLAQAEKPTASFRMEPSATPVVGKGLKGILVLDIPEGTHGYQNPPSDPYENPVRLRVEGTAFKLWRVEYPKGVEFKMDGADKASKVYEGRLEVPFVLIPTTASAKSIPFRVDYQLCTLSTCYPPSTLVVELPIKVSPAAKKITVKSDAKVSKGTKG